MATSNERIASNKVSQDALRIESAKHTRNTMQEEVANLKALLPVLQNENALPDELVVPMHNIIAIAPEEQYRFLGNIRQLFSRLPTGVQDLDEVRYVIDRLDKMSKSSVNTKIQETDLSLYWSAYRKFVYQYGCPDTNKQLSIQKRIQRALYDVACLVIAKREQGIITATKIIGDGRVSLG